MKNALSILFVLISVSATAQLRHPVYGNWDSGYSVGTYGRYQVSSNAISSELVWQAFQGDFLQRKTREAVSNRLLGTNGLGVDLDYGLYARHLPDSAKGIGWYINIADRTHAHGRYTKDLFDVVMFGNAMFAGKTIDLSNIYGTFYTYKQFEIGLLKQVKSSNGNWNIGFGVSLITGNRNFELEIEQGSLFTQADGEFLDGTIQGNIRSSSIGSGQYFDDNGLGMSAALSVGYESNRFGIRLDADDIGFINWSGKLKHTELDSTFRFEGVDVNLFASDGTSFSSINLDSVVNGFATIKEGSSYMRPLPGRIRLEGFYRITDKNLRTYAGIQFRIAKGYLPYGYVGVDSPLPKGFHILGQFAYGGFGSWHVGVEIRKKFKDVFEIRLGTNNLEGYILPMFGTSQSAFIGVAGYF